MLLVRLFFLVRLLVRFLRGDKRDGRMIPRSFIALNPLRGSSVIRITVGLLQHTIAYNLAPYIRSGVYFKNVVSTAIRISWLSHPHCSFGHRLASCFAAFSHRPPEPHLRSAGRQCSLRVNMAGSRQGVIYICIAVS